jgi:Tfp pilus assembly protein PilP
MNTVVPMPISLLLACALAQVPNPAAAINAAKNAKAQTEAAQKKNAEALDPQAAPAAQGRGTAAGAPAQAPAPSAPAQVTPGTQAPPPPQGAGYSYDPSGRRDPFVSLTARGGEVAPAGARPAGVPGLLVNEVTVKGVLKSSKGGFIALVQAPDNRTYIVKAGDKVFDGLVKTITQDTVVFSQDVNDPLSLVKQREVRKAIRPEAR